MSGADRSAPALCPERKADPSLHEPQLPEEPERLLLGEPGSGDGPETPPSSQRLCHHIPGVARAQPLDEIGAERSEGVAETRIRASEIDVGGCRLVPHTHGAGDDRQPSGRRLGEWSRSLGDLDEQMPGSGWIDRSPRDTV